MTTPVTSVTTNTGSSTSSTSAVASATTVDYNSFLQLLVQELKNQDPTAPSDPTQYLSQLASFSNVEQAVNTNTKLGTLLTTSALTQAETVIGKTVTSSDGKTSGVVTAVALGSDGSATATLAGGNTLTLDNTVTVGTVATGTGS